MSKASIPDKYIYIPIIALFTALIVKFILFTRIYAEKFFLGDLSVHLPTLFFLKAYGFLNIVPNWYQGTYVLLKSYPPGWFFFSYPIYSVINDIFITTFISIGLIYLLGFIFVLLLGKVLKISIAKRILFFVLFYANPLILNTVFDTARIPDIFSWTLFIPLLALILYYKDKKLNKYFYILLALMYILLILSHVWVSILSLVLLFALILKRPIEEKFCTGISLVSALIVTSFWWIPFSISMLAGHNKDFFPAKQQFLTLDSIFSFNTIIILALITIFYLYWRSKDYSSKELWFFLPILSLAVIVLSRLLVLIPVLNKIPANPFNYFFLFILLIYFFKTKFSSFRNIIGIALTLVAIGFVLLTFFHFTDAQTSYLEIENDFIKILPSVNKSYLFLGSFDDTEEFTQYAQFRKVIAYATIYHNLTTPSGGYWHGAPDIYQRTKEINQDLKIGDCANLIKGIKEFKVEEVISHDNHCLTLEECGIKEKVKKGHACIMVPKIL